MKRSLIFVLSIISLGLFVSCSNIQNILSVTSGFTVEVPSKTEAMRMLSRSEDESLNLVTTLETKDGSVIDSFSTTCQFNELVSVQLSGKKGDEVCVSIKFTDIESTNLVWAYGKSDYFVLENKETDIDITMHYSYVALSCINHDYSVIVKDENGTVIENNSTINYTKKLYFSLTDEQSLTDYTIKWYYNDQEILDETSFIEIQANTYSKPTSTNKIYAIISDGNDPVWITNPFCFTISLE